MYIVYFSKNKKVQQKHELEKRKRKRKKKKAFLKHGKNRPSSLKEANMDSLLENWIKINFDITIREDFSMTVVFFFFFLFYYKNFFN
jgi:hypothetical protein